MRRGRAGLSPSLLLAALLGASPGCGDDASGGARPAVAEPFAGHECEACGMIVRDQPSPRGQVVHRDGARFYFCAVPDLLTYLAAPSPHGAATSVWVEVLDPARPEPLALETAARPWRAAAGAHFVVEVDRPRVMGFGVLAYASAAEARAVAGRIGGRALDWDALGVYASDRAGGAGVD